MSLDYAKLANAPAPDLSHLPQDKGWPVIGHTIPFLTDTLGLTRRMYQANGPVVVTNAFFQDVVTLLGPEANDIVLTDRDRVFSSKLAWDTILDRLFPNGLMLKDFDEHRHHRRILQSAFKKPVIQGYLDKMSPRLHNGVEHFSQQREFGFKGAIKSLLLDVASEVFLGMDIGKDAKRINQAFIDTMMGSAAVVKIPLPFNTWGKALKGRATLEDFVGKHIPHKRANPGNDFFSQICSATDEDGNVFDDEAVRDHMIFLLFAAHDTTTSTLCSIVYLLTKNPEWQARLRKEFLSLENQMENSELSYDALGAMTDAELVLKEALRLYPPLPSITRRTIDEVTIMGHRLPANTTVSISPLLTHYMPDIWDDPEKFDPDRFGPERAEHKRNSHQWLPFGGGAHKCIGLNFAEIQVKLFLFHLLRRHEVSVATGYEMKVNRVPLNFPKDDLMVSIKPV